MKRSVGTAFSKLIKVSSLFIVLQSSAQDIPVGTWRTHYSYTSITQLQRTSDKVFAASQNGLFSIDIEDNTIRILSKIDGLSDAGVSAMNYSINDDLLVIGYRSGLTDFITDQGIQSLREIFNSNLEGDKHVNDIAFYEDKTYLATGLGIVVVSNDDVQIRENFVQIGENGMEIEAQQIVVFNDQLIAKTDQGIQFGDLSTNLLDFNNWTHIAVSNSIEHMLVVNDELFAVENLDLLEFNSGSWTDTGVDLPLNSTKPFLANSDLTVSTGSEILAFNGTAFTQVETIPDLIVNDIEFVEGNYWFADDQIGLYTSNGLLLSPQGPYMDEYSRIRYVNGTVYGFHSPSPVGYDGSVKIPMFSQFENGVWAMVGVGDLNNVTDVAHYNGSTYFSSLGDGLFDLSNNQTIIDIPNSDVSLDTMITALAARQQLAVTSFENTEPLQLFNGEEWTSIPESTLTNNELIDLAISSTGVVWSKTTNGRIVAYDPDDDQSITLFAFPGQLNDFEISVEDDVWIAASGGTGSYIDASFIFDNNELIEPTFEGRELFDNEPIHAIETDGGNRVWFGTENGVWVFNENITERVAVFDQENSPLPSNKIEDLVYNPVNGEMFILTDQGLVSYRSASSIKSTRHSDVNIFPNPVEPGYVGLVGMEGLAKNTTIKITDVNGNLVNELRANGSSASWDLMNLSNNKVSTGIYFIFSATSDGEETYVGKIAVIR